MISRFAFLSVIFAMIGVFALIIGAFSEDKYIWQVLMLIVICFIVVLYIISKVRDPRFFFGLAILVYGLIGGWNNHTPSGATIDWKNEEYFLLAFTGVMVGYFLTDVICKNDLFAVKKYTFIKRPADVSLWVMALMIFGLIAFSVDFIQIGAIPIVQPELRFKSMPVFRLVYFLGGSLACLYLIMAYQWRWHKFKPWLMFSLYMVFGVMALFRSMPVMMSIIIFLYVFQTAKSKRVLFTVTVGALLFFTLLNGIKLYRDVNNYGGYYAYSNMVIYQEELPDYIIPFTPVLFTIHEGSAVFQQLRDANIDYGYGQYILESYSTILPGKQRCIGDVVNQMINAPVVNTKTPSMPGLFYIVGGIFAIGFFSIVLGVFLSAFYQFKKDKIVYGGFFFYYVFSWVLLNIHGGMLFQPSKLIVFIILLTMCHYGILVRYTIRS